MTPVLANEQELGRDVVDSEFVALVRRYRPSSLVPLLAQVAAQHMTRESWLETGQTGLYAPWVLAEVARVSLAHGNEHRQVATMADLTRCCAAFTAVGDPELASGDPEGLSSFLLRTSEQLEYQTDLFLEMSRTAALFDQTETETDRPPKVLAPGWQRELFGASLVEFVGAGQLLHFACRPNGGIFDPGWLDAPQLAEIAAVMDSSVLRRVWHENYLTDVAGFRATNGRPPPGPWRRFDFNPLGATPVVADLLDDGRWIIPSPGLLARRFSPLGVYYAGMRRWGTPFSDDLGPLFEAYVGRHLRLLPDAHVIPAITYGRGNEQSIDWFVVLPEVVLMVEVKSVRPTDQVRRGGPQAGAELTRMLQKGFRQLRTSNELIAARHPKFAAIPQDRPRVGLVITMESFHTGNSPWQRDQYQVPLDFPALVVSAREPEGFVSVANTSPGVLLLNHLQDPNVDGWSLHSALVGHERGRNAVLDQAWASYPWSNLNPSPSG